ncbi:ribosome biogenesis GTP-binding protein YihA/YsxC [Iamia majanohamensis]|uniref:Probable GTP-binding protein EngB n=1 Tax=Iamia majanohamensis TaxID=467976 RepID=A0AAE9YFD7_9ACTN|nr:ribosome biogenesis GTP-binding protein YihA/YsxC [Iamia majanohamensis]WCO67562.1 ribosome biogenesis GTP-binding protein YihA/YsxC [Iamia majanohamensis]
MASPATRPLSLRFVTSADALARLPATRAEVAVVGRSNVGKSSLLNALANRTGLAHVSKTPGRTRLLNCFAFEEPGLEDATLVDCPGYGYAKAPQKMRAGWQQMIEGYLLGREELETILVLVDGAVGPTPLDVQMVEWLEHHERPFTIVATKHDKVKPSGRDRRKRDLAAGLGLDPGEVLWTSASKGVNVDRARALVRGLVAP